MNDSEMRVRDLMTADPMALAPTDNVATLYDVLDRNRIRHLPIVDEEGDMVGLVTHRDLVRSSLGRLDEALPLSSQREMLRNVRIEEIMMPDVETIDAESPITTAAQLMLENKFGCLPVVENRQLVGILTESDFVRHVARAATGSAGATDA